MKYKLCCLIMASLMLWGCIAPGELIRPELPSLSYSRNIHSGNQDGSSSSTTQTAVVAESAQRVSSRAEAAIQGAKRSLRIADVNDARASVHFVNTQNGAVPGESEMVSNMDASMQAAPSYTVTHSRNSNVRPYQGPLHVGEPGASSSLWRMHGPGSQLFRDHRAFQPMDLITVVVSETAQGSKEADTETKRESSFLAGITELFNFTDSVVAANPGLDTATMIDADFQSEFTGEGETTRKGSLQARIAAMVVEVLPNGLMRIEGEKIIAVNNEEQVLVISGLVRPRDVNSSNEVMSTKIAHLRVDYYGQGLIGDVQYVGWFGRLINKIWPF
ncbi:flagellar basal body L-ring protein FlgH [bacterium]|nr:flagellar basal body L-ring protein FlgH [bacterium]